MSGIEIVGLILGSIPLVISALEHYADGVTTLQRYRRYRLELTMLINILRTEQTKLLNTCDKLLVGLAPPSRIEAMLDEPFGPMWCEPDLQKDIQLRLWRSHGVFETTISDVYAAIQEIYVKLGLRPDGTIQWLEGSKSSKSAMKNTLQGLLKRASFSLRKTSYDDLLSRIKDGIGSLETLTAQTVELEKSHKIRSQGRHLTLLRRAFKSVYRALQHGLGVRCTDSHALHLALAPRPANITPLDDDETVSQGLSFRLAIPNHPEEGTSSSALSCSHVVVRHMAATIPLSPSTPSPPSRSLSPIPRHMISPGPPATKRSDRSRKLVSFLGQVSTSYSTSSTTASSTNVNITGTTNITSIHHSTGIKSNTTISNTSVTNTSTTTATITTVNNVPQDPSSLQTSIPDGSVAACLCETLSSVNGGGPSLHCYGLVEDPCDGKKYGVYQPDESASLYASKWSTVSLRQALKGQEGITAVSAKASGKGKGKATSARLPILTYPERLALALTLSSSVLQLHGTPWLGSRALTCDDILFFDHNRHSGGSGSSITPYAQAFVTAGVPSRSQPDASLSGAGIVGPGGGPAAAYNDGIVSDLDLTLPWLGVLLVELMLGRVVGGNTGTGFETLSVFAAAEKLLGAVTEQGGINYASAVRWCLRQYGCKMDVEDEKCQQGVYENVVVLLDEAYKEV